MEIQELIDRAEREYPGLVPITPCAGRKDWEGSITVYKSKTLFWFNTADGSTHILQEINNENSVCLEYGKVCSGIDIRANLGTND